MTTRRLRSGDLIECSGSRQHFLGRYLRWQGEFICDGCRHGDGSAIDEMSRIEFGNPARAVWVADGSACVLHESEMSKLDDTLMLLRERGVVRATFHASGELASVDFAPDASHGDDSQHEATKTEARVKRSATGGLVPRVESNGS